MLVLGDVFAVLAIMALAFFSAVSLNVIGALLLPERASIAAQRIQARPGRTMASGFGLLLLSVIVIVAMISVQQPVLTILAAVLGAGLLAASALGRSGLAVLIADRIDDDHPSRFRAILRGACLTEGVSMMPFIGWFILMPFMVMLGLGAMTGRARGRALRAIPADAAPPFPEARP